MYKVLFILSLFIVGPSNLHADSPNFDVTASLLNFGYEEFSTTGRSLNRETGFLPGVKLRYYYKMDNLLILPLLSLYEGRVDYIGSTQSGQPHTTQTIESITSYGLDILINQSTRHLKTLIGFRNWRWDRDILTRNGILGLHELYSWTELIMGVRVTTDNIDSSFYAGNFSLIYIINPKMKVFLPNSSETLTLGEKPGVRLSFGKKWIFTKTDLDLTLYVEYWEFGRSNSVFTNDFFGNSALITEPDSKSLHRGIELTYSSYF